MGRITLFCRAGLVAAALLGCICLAGSYYPNPASTTKNQTISGNNTLIGTTTFNGDAAFTEGVDMSGSARLKGLAVALTSQTPDTTYSWDGEEALNVYTIQGLSGYQGKTFRITGKFSIGTGYAGSENGRYALKLNGYEFYNSGNIAVTDTDIQHGILDVIFQISSSGGGGGWTAFGTVRRWASGDIFTVTTTALDGTGAIDTTENFALETYGQTTDETNGSTTWVTSNCFIVEQLN